MFDRSPIWWCVCGSCSEHGLMNWVVFFGGVLEQACSGTDGLGDV